MQLGLKLGSKELIYTESIFSLYNDGYFQYIELFIVPKSYNDTIEYWKQFNIPFVIHAPHSTAGMNLSLKNERENNKNKLQETFKFADTLKAEYIIFHSGVDGDIEETITQLRPFIDNRCLIENKPLLGLNNEKCLGATTVEIKKICNELNTGFCLDFGHAICAANSLKKEPLDFIKDFMVLKPKMYHLTDGDYSSEKDTHYHYGKGSFPIKKLLSMIPDNTKVTNEAKHESDINLDDFLIDSVFLMSNKYLRKVNKSDINILYEWANDPDTRANSFNQNNISFDTHKEWFKNKIESESTLFYIYQIANDNIGQVRFEIDKNTALINYSINPIFRGKGYGYKILQFAENKIKTEYKNINILIGEVKNNNEASISIFRRLNYNEYIDNDRIVFKKNI